MCSYNAVMGVPTCLSNLMKNARAQWGFNGYVTSDTDSVHDAYASHQYPQPNPTPERATALALLQGQCDINSGDTYNGEIFSALAGHNMGSLNLTINDLNVALFHSLRQRFDLGLFDPKAADAWPDYDDIGTINSSDLSLKASDEAIVLLRNDGNMLPVPRGKKNSVIGPHANAIDVLTQPYPFKLFCPDGEDDCIKSPVLAIS